MLQTDFAPYVVEANDSFAAMIERVAAINPYLVPYGQALTGNWVSALILLEDQHYLDTLLEQILARYGATKRSIAAAIFLNSYAWYLSAAAIACYVLERQVPSLAFEHVDLRIDFVGSEKRIDVALLPSELDQWAEDFAVCEEDLQLRLRSEIEAHFEPLIEVLHTRTKLGRRAQWNLVADACASVFVWFGERMGAVETSCSEGLALITHPDSPMRFSKTGYFTVDHAGFSRTFRKRGGCCLTYKSPEGNNCSTCPLIPIQERNARIKAWMETQSRPL